ncbi:ABC transporter ATP-binding protein [Rhodopila sp.]|uniref:ABC transporter ATP-binding protein n=1 Tax=Rhodopila sp. TaxID=2480087 RepID=UPI002C9F9876|nr:ABC transporter ATP-binding protein [Rhodopila sp.]HVZ10194.1 ABC transporter ATP-binding protein [Rhodopila sp.]
MLLEARGIVKAFGAFRAVDGAELEVAEGEIIGLIGPNGAGKSTFFNCLAGDAQPTAGTIRFLDREVTRATPEEHARLGLARTFQVPVTFEDMTVVDNVMVGAFLRHGHRTAARRVAEEVLAFTGLDALADAPARSLGTPGRKRLEIARALATEPRLLLLDEALAGLTPAEVRLAIELVRRIQARGVTIVIVEHIMEVILSLTGRAIVFHQGKVIAAGAPRAVVDDPAVVAAYLGHHMKRVRL